MFIVLLNRTKYVFFKKYAIEELELNAMDADILIYGMNIDWKFNETIHVSYEVYDVGKCFLQNAYVLKEVFACYFL